MPLPDQYRTAAETRPRRTQGIPLSRRCPLASFLSLTPTYLSYYVVDVSGKRKRGHGEGMRGRGVDSPRVGRVSRQGRAGLPMGKQTGRILVIPVNSTGGHLTGGHLTGGHLTGGHLTGGHLTGGHFLQVPPPRKGQYGFSGVVQA